MRTDRRKFMGGVFAGGLAGALPRCCDASEKKRADYARLDEILSRPVLKRQLFTSAVIIRSVELLRYQGKFLCRVRSTDGAEGISVAHGTMSTLYPIFLNRLQ
ncbi:MAG: mandelate racemase/muconate lactonizing enzyme family protein, partial [Planctomycetota bacterium]